jgi:cytochrome c biogenesis protein
VAEGTQSGTAILSQSDGVLLQELPFAVELKKFIVEHYSTGMPKLFASEIIIHDKATGEKTPARASRSTTPPATRASRFTSPALTMAARQLKLRAVPMAPGAQPFDVEGVVGGSTQLTNKGGAAGGDTMTLEFTALRTINVENFAGAPNMSGADVRKVDLRESVESRLGAANKTVTKKELRNVGPSVSYKLRDAAGQAREYHNYMLPVDTGDGTPVFLLGVREAPSEPFRYLRVPADDQGSMDGFVRMRAALADPAARDKAVRRYVAQAIEPSRRELAEQLSQSASRALAVSRVRCQLLQASQPVGCKPFLISWKPTCRRPSALARVRC